MSVVRPPTGAELAARPVDRLASLVELADPDAVVDWCAALLRGAAPDDPGAPHLDWLGGASSRSRGSKALDLDYWPRVWAARGLLHVYRAQGAPAVVDGLTDESWRVRELCAKVARAHEVGAAAAALLACCADEVSRVRAAAVRALALVGEAEDAEAVRDCMDDPEPAVRAAAEKALRDMSRRLDRDL